jgi:glycosyltransferase 2 family protein
MRTRVRRLRANSVTFRPQARTGLVWLGLVVSALFAYLAVRGVDAGEVWDALGNCRWWTLVPAFFLLAAANVVRAWRWQLQFAPATRPRFWPALSALLIGTFFNNVLPARAGEAAQVVALRRSSRTSVSETAATVLLGRVWDVLSVLVLLFCLAPWLPTVSWLRAAVYLAVGLVAALVVMVLTGPRLFRVVLRPLARLPFLTRAHTDSAAAGLWRGLLSVRRPLPALVAFVLTTASWVLFGLSNWLVLEGFSLGLSPLAGILVSIALSLAMILPSSPASLGVFEAAVLVALKPYGVPKAEGLSAALVIHALNLFPYLIAGIVCLRLEAGNGRYAPTGAAGPGGPAGLQNQ